MLNNTTLIIEIKMKITVISILSIILASCSAFGQFGGLLGGSKKSSNLMDKAAYITQGTDLVTKYSIIQASFLEVGAAQKEAEGDFKKAEILRIAAKQSINDPTEDNLKEGSQLADDVVEDLEGLKDKEVSYTESGKKSLQKTLPQTAISMAGGVILIKDTVDWFKQFPDQVKAAGFTGALKLKKDLGGAVFVAKSVATDLPKWLKAVRAATGYAKKQGVDTKDIEKESAKIDLP
jgi:hypothetical protein